MIKQEEPSLKIYCLPIVRPCFSQLVGYELDVRLIEKGLGTIEQEKFLPIAERSGLGLTLARWEFEEACNLVSKMLRKENEFEYVSMHMLPSQLKRKTYVKEILRVCEDVEPNPQKMAFDIGEELFGSYRTAVVDRIYELCGAGFKVNITNYYNKFVSVEELKEMPISNIKLPESYMQTVETDNNVQETIRQLTLALENVDKEVIAPGVMNQKQELLLMRLGCEVMQGPHFGQAIHARAVPSYRPKNLKHIGDVLPL